MQLATHIPHVSRGGKRITLSKAAHTEYSLTKRKPVISVSSVCNTRWLDSTCTSIGIAMIVDFFYRECGFFFSILLSDIKI